MGFARGDLIAPFEVQTIEGHTFAYRTIWQRRNRLLVILTPSRGDSERAAALRSRVADFQRLGTECVITYERIGGLEAPAVVLADRWGEIVYVEAPPVSAGFPTPDALIEWFDYIQNRCPECEGEVK